jgi:hypothetical protein
MKSQLESAFAGIKEAQAPKPPAPQLVPAPKQPVSKSGMAKSTNPDFEPVKIYLRKDTRKAAARLWEDRNGGDFSELVEHLLSEYLGA